MTAARSRSYLIALFAGGAAVHGAGNFLAAFLADQSSTLEGVFVGIWLGCLLAQFGLLAIWLGLASPSPFTRGLVLVALAMALDLPPILGDYFHQTANGDFSEVAFRNRQLTMVLSYPLAMASLVAPLWFLRLMGWRIAHVSDGPDSIRRSQFSLAGLLGAMTCMALMLAAGVQACHIAAEEPAGFWFGMGVYCFVLFLCGALLLVPATVILSRNLWMGLFLTGGILLAPYLALLWLLAIGVRLIAGSLSFADLAFLGAIPAGPVAGFAVALLTPLLLVRRFGYRLHVGSGCPHILPPRNLPLPCGIVR